MAELSCKGTLIGEMTSSASTRSSASKRRTRSTSVRPRGNAHWRTISCAALTGSAFGSYSATQLEKCLGVFIDGWSGSRDAKPAGGPVKKGWHVEDAGAAAAKRLTKPRPRRKHEHGTKRTRT